MRRRPCLPGDKPPVAENKAQKPGPRHGLAARPYRHTVDKTLLAPVDGPMTDAAKIVFVGDLNYYAKGSSRVRALESLGQMVTPLSHTTIGGEDVGHPVFSLVFRIAWQLGIHLDTERVNAKILNAVEREKPGLLWIDKGNMVSPGTLVQVKILSPGTRIVSYSDDDMFNPLNRTRAYTRALPHYDFVFVTKTFNADPGELPSLGAKACIAIDKAFDPDQHRPLDLGEAEKQKYGADVGFIGTYAPERGECLNRLAAEGFDIRVWGNGWQGFSPASSNLRIERHPLVNRPEDLRYTKGVNATRINLGFLRKVNRDLQTDRSIEIPACGGFLMAERSVEHERLFDDGREAVFFDDEDDLIAKIRHYLANDKERQEIAASGRRRCLDGGYSHRDRVREMIERALAD